MRLLRGLGKGRGRQGCGLDLAPFWYTSPFKLCAPFHLISPLSVGFPRNSFLSHERFVTLAYYVRVHSNYKHHFDRICHCSPTQHVICPVSVAWLSVVVHKSFKITSTFWSLWSHFLLVSNAARYLTRERCVTLIFVRKSFQISSTLLITFIALPLPSNMLFVSWSLRDAHLLCMSPFKFRPLSGRFDRTISPEQHVICLLSVAWRDNQRLLRRLTSYSRKSSSALKSRMVKREFTERYLTMMRLMVHYERPTHIILCPVYHLQDRTQNVDKKKRRKKNYQTGKKIHRSPSSPTTKAVKQ